MPRLRLDLAGPLHTYMGTWPSVFTDQDGTVSGGLPARHQDLKRLPCTSRCVHTKQVIGLTPLAAQAIIGGVRKNEILDTLSTTRIDLQAAISGLTPEQMLQPGVAGFWSVKDILAHLVAWEAEVVTALNQAQNRRKPSLIDIEDIDDWNEEQYHINADRPLEAILADFAGVHKMLCQMVEDFDERALNDFRRYPWMEGEPLFFLIEDNVILHEQEHASEIRAWRDSLSA